MDYTKLNKANELQHSIESIESDLFILEKDFTEVKLSTKVSDYTIPFCVHAKAFIAKIKKVKKEELQKLKEEFNNL